MAPLASSVRAPVSATTAAQPRTATVCVEGNIGSGKSTLVARLETLGVDAVFLPEPVDSWRDVGGANLLDLYYRDQPRWAYTFQSCAALSLLRHHDAPVARPLRLMERSLHSSQRCFAALLAESGALSTCEAALLEQWYEWSAPRAPVDLFVYVRADPEVSHRRLRRRGRDEEAAVPLSFLADLHRLHEDWLMGRESAPVIVVDANLEGSAAEAEYRRVAAALTALA